MSDLVFQWNDYLLDAIRSTSTPPPVAAKAMAAVQTAVFDTVNTIEGSPYESYLVNTGHQIPMNASAEAGVAAAAYTVMKALFPTVTTLDTHYAESLATVANGAAKDAGIAWGQQVANMILELRANDGSKDVVTYTLPEAPGNWHPVLPAFAGPLLPQWPGVDPWTMQSGDQFRPDGPPALDSAEYTAAFNEVKAYGSATSTVRTADQTEIAKFWADGAGTETPPGHWNSIAQDVAESSGLLADTLLDHARMLAMLGTTVADAAIVAWDAKYTYGNWRPIEAIREADTDGNAATTADASWTPLLATPPFPDYISGHSTFSSAAATILSEVFGMDSVQFTTVSDALPGVTRSFDSFSDAAAEAGISRIYGGIHWQFSNTDALEAGSALGHYVADNFFRFQEVLTNADDALSIIDMDPIEDPSAYVLKGMGGDDRLETGVGRTELMGGTGNDTLIGGGSDDTLTGGEGSDHFVYRVGDGADVITDLSGDDVLVIDSEAVCTQWALWNLASYHQDGSLTFTFGDGASLTIEDASHVSHNNIVINNSFFDF